MASDTMTQLVIPGALVMVSTPDRGVPVASTADWHDALLNVKSGVTPAMKLVAFTICTHCAPADRPAPSGAYVTSPGLSLLCEQTNFSRTHVQRQLSLLRANGWLVTITRPAAGRPARYLLSVPVAVARAGGYRLAGEDVEQRDTELVGATAAPARRTPGLAAVTSSDRMLTTPPAPGGPSEPGRGSGCLASGTLERPALVRRRKRATYSAGGRGVVRVRRKPRTLPPSAVTDVIVAASSVAPVTVGDTASAAGPEQVDEARPMAVGETSYVPFGGGQMGSDVAAGTAGGAVRAVSDISTGAVGAAQSPTAQSASSAQSASAPSSSVPSATAQSASAQSASASAISASAASGRSLGPRPIVPVSERVAGAARAPEASLRGVATSAEPPITPAPPVPAPQPTAPGPIAPVSQPPAPTAPASQPTMPAPQPPAPAPATTAPATTAPTAEAPSPESQPQPQPQPQAAAPEPESEAEPEPVESPVVDEIRMATRQVIEILAKMLRRQVEDFAELDRRVYEVLSEGDWAPVELATHLVNFVANGVWVNGDDVADNIRWRMDRLPLGVTECGCKSCLGWRAAPERPPRPAPPSAPGPSAAGASARTSTPVRAAGPPPAGPVAAVTTAAATKAGSARSGRSPAANPPAPPARPASTSDVVANQASSAKSASQVNRAGPVEQSPAAPPPPPDLAAIAAAAAAGAEEARRNEEAKRLQTAGISAAGDSEPGDLVGGDSIVEGSSAQTPPGTAGVQNGTSQEAEPLTED
ncbi:hypothetical protein [Parafrankia sp. BMG5.11]|uniref:hypothetical protein n=1 Tax=Parafrankia sp. BMG5.11 TaxID=222540 RepID=UPI00103D9CFE|nr:hypothetical protein [Parafrankia sp. BMG5.11]TCJ35320.1 hypothetical protein E0504_27725 [Parafrankia sp. BMG5.11]